MGNVTFSLSMSLDGFVAGPNDEIDPLHDWLFSGEHESRHASFAKLSAASRAVLDERIASIGASVVGRNTFEVSGRCGGTPPFAIRRSSGRGARGRHAPAVHGDPLRAQTADQERRRHVRNRSLHVHVLRRIHRRAQ
jgi:hypothetical protein